MLNQRLTSKHALPNLFNNIFPIVSSHKHDSPTPPPHSPGAPKAVNKIDSCVRNIIQDDMPYHSCVDSSGSQVRYYKNLGVWENAFSRQPCRFCWSLGVVLLRFCAGRESGKNICLLPG